MNVLDPDEKDIIINADLSSVYTRSETFTIIHDLLQYKQETLTSESKVNVEEITCDVSPKKYGLVINRLRESGNGGIMKLDSSTLNNESCQIQYVTNTTTWYVGAALMGISVGMHQVLSGVVK